MPARSNLYQRLVAAIQRQIDPRWMVQESRMLEDLITHQPREVDIVIEAQVAGQNIYVSIECRDHTRRNDVTWVEAMAKKHENLCTSKLVLWSSKGFSEAAIKKAQALKIEATLHGNEDDADWATIAKDVLAGYVHLLRPTFSFDVDVVTDHGTLRRYSGQPDQVAALRDGRLVPFSNVMLGLQQRPELPSILLDRAPPGNGEFHAELTGIDWDLHDSSGVRLGRIERIRMGIITDVQVARLAGKSIRYGESLHTLAEADMVTGKFQVHVDEPRTGERKFHAVLRPTGKAPRRRSKREPAKGTTPTPKPASLKKGRAAKGRRN